MQLSLSLSRSWFYFITLSSTLQTSALIWTETLPIPALPLRSTINPFDRFCFTFFLWFLLTEMKNTLISQWLLLVRLGEHMRTNSPEKKVPVISHGSLLEIEKILMSQITLRFAKTPKSAIKSQRSQFELKYFSSNSPKNKLSEWQYPHSVYSSIFYCMTRIISLLQFK